MDWLEIEGPGSALVSTLDESAITSSVPHPFSRSKRRPAGRNGETDDSIPCNVLTSNGGR